MAFLEFLFLSNVRYSHEWPSCGDVFVIFQQVGHSFVRVAVELTRGLATANIARQHFCHK